MNPKVEVDGAGSAQDIPPRVTEREWRRRYEGVQIEVTLQGLLGTGEITVSHAIGTQRSQRVRGIGLHRDAEG